MIRLAPLLALLAVLSLGLSACQAQPQPPAGVKYHANVVYTKSGGEELKIDIAHPEKEGEPRACILMIHGGGWRGGDKSHLTPVIFELAQQGYTAATVQYRFAPKHRFPAQIEDVKCAVRYLRAHAEEYGLDPERIGACGFSAGGHLSMILGTMGKDDGFEGEGGWADQSSQVQAVLSYFGPTDFTLEYPAASAAIVNDFVGFTLEENAEVRKQASPITYVSEGDAPMLLFQGTKDRLVPHEQAMVMAEAMTNAGIPGRVELLIGFDHGWGGADLERTKKETLEFFARHLGKK